MLYDDASDITSVVSDVPIVEASPYDNTNNGYVQYKHTVSKTEDTVNLLMDKLQIDEDIGATAIDVLHERSASRAFQGKSAAVASIYEACNETFSAMPFSPDESAKTAKIRTRNLTQKMKKEGIKYDPYDNIKPMIDRGITTLCENSVPDSYVASIHDTLQKQSAVEDIQLIAELLLEHCHTVTAKTIAYGSVYIYLIQHDCQQCQLNKILPSKLPIKSPTLRNIYKQYQLIIQQ